MINRYLHFYLSLFLFVLFASCNGQRQPNLPKESDSVGLDDTRPDSVLQFNSMILSIFEDSKGNYWLGSWCDGLCKYDPLASPEAGEKRFTYYTVEDGIPGVEVIQFNNRQVPRGNSVGSIQEDRNGNIVFATLGGIVRFDGQSFTTIQPEKNSLLITGSFDALGKDTDATWENEVNHLWFGNTQSNGAYRYDGEKLKQLTFPIPMGYDNGWRSQYATYSLYKDSDKNIWFGTESGGIMRYNGASFTCINQQEEKGIVRAFFQDDSGKVWMSNVLMGLYYYDHAAHLAGQESLVNFTKEKGYYTLNDIRSNGLLDRSKMLDGIQAVAQDEEGNLWFGTYDDGLWRYDPSASGNAIVEEFTHFTTKNGLPHNTVKTIYKDKQGELWFGIGREQAGVYHFDGTAFKRFEGDE